MKKYDIVVSHVIDDFVWNVYERSTEQIIETFFFEEDARDYAKFLERGGGFDGFTPSFMLTISPDLDVNAKFEQLMA